MTADQQSKKALFDSIDIPQMDHTMDKDFTEEDGKAIIEQYFTKTRLTQKQPGHRLWINNKEVHQPTDLDHSGAHQEEQITTTDPDTFQPPPGLEQPVHTYIHPAPKAMARSDNYKPPPPVDRQTTTSLMHNWTTSRSTRSLEGDHT
eukprot:850891-Amphidinium_carterae.2